MRSDSDAVIEKLARAMFDQDHDEGWDRGEPLTKQIYLANATAALSALAAGDDLGGGLTTAGAAYWNMLYRNNVTDVATKAAEATREACAAEVDKFGKWRRNSVGWACDEIAARIRKLKPPA